MDTRASRGSVTWRIRISSRISVRYRYSGSSRIYGRIFRSSSLARIGFGYRFRAEYWPELCHRERRTPKGNVVGFGLSQEATEGSIRQRVSTSEAGLILSVPMEAMGYEDFV